MGVGQYLSVTQTKYIYVLPITFQWVDNASFTIINNSYDYSLPPSLYFQYEPNHGTYATVPWYVYKLVSGDPVILAYGVSYNVRVGYITSQRVTLNPAPVGGDLCYIQIGGSTPSPE